MAAPRRPLSRRDGALLSRIPIRVRLTLAFAIAMAVVLAGMGTFLYLRLESELNRQIDRNLRVRADDIATLVGSSDSALSESDASRLGLAGENFAQVIAASGGILDATPPLRTRLLLTPTELERARREAILVDRSSLPVLEDPIRLLARPVTAQDQRLVVVVGTSLEESRNALGELRTELTIGGPIALLLAAIAGYLVAAGALRPVEWMRRRATAISSSKPGQRLPVPPARDEVHRLGETLNEMLARLEAGIDRERRFVADASHELRTPLALMKTELELALRRTRTQAELEAALRSAAEETDRLAQLAEDLLVIARSDQGELSLRRTPVSARDVLSTVAERYARRAEETGRPLVAEAPDALLVTGDAVRLEQAIGNLVENAFRYGAGPVQLRGLSLNGQVELHVTDEGGGFPTSFLPQAFERFSRADEARARGGSGLGLAIVEVIARAHGGSAHAANRPTGGADVWLALPGAES